MKEQYSCIVQFKIKAECLAPIRTAGTETGYDAVLRLKNGRAVIQGTSIAGVLRAWLSKTEPDAVLPLFGSGEQKTTHSEGSLIVSDGIFEPESENQITRAHVKIDAATGTAVARGLFTETALGAGAVFRFTLTWFGNAGEETGPEASAVVQLLEAIQSGEITFGAGRSDGFGKVKIVEAIRNVYHMENTEERYAWIEGRNTGSSVPVIGMNRNEVVFAVSGIFPRVLVRSGEIDIKQGSKTALPLNENNLCLIPASSIKGAVRSQFESIEQYIGQSSAVTERVFGYAQDGGSIGRAGRIRFSDALLRDNRSSKINRIRINRFTGGVVNGAVFSEQVPCSSTEFRICMPQDNTACALMLLTLRDLCLGMYGFGGGSAHGLGYLKNGKVVVKTPDGRCLEMSVNEQGDLRMKDDTGLYKEWNHSLKEELA